jgi:hypothetical protein
VFFKDPVQVALVRKAQFIRYFVHPHIAVQQTVFHQFQLVIDDVLLHGFVHMLFEIAAQVSFRNTKVLTDVFCPYTFRLVDICLYVLQDVQRLFFRGLVDFSGRLDAILRATIMISVLTKCCTSSLW